MATFYGVDIDLIAIVISVVSLVLTLILALYTLYRERPIISVEKHMATIQKRDDNNFIDFVFFLNNSGDRPTTIKSIQFQQNDFIPKAVFIELTTGTIPILAGIGLQDEKINIFDIPFSLMPNTSKRLEAQLNFSNQPISGTNLKIIITHTRGKYQKDFDY